MAREKKDGHFINCYIKQELWDEITRVSKTTMIPKTAIVEKALEEYFEKMNMKAGTRTEDGSNR